MIWDKYYPNYEKLYPGVEITPEVLAVLRQSDRKMKYMEYDLKVETPIKDENGDVVGLLPSREDSYERLLEMEKQFSGVCTPEELYEEKEEVEELYRCLDLLDADERALIDARFFDGITEREYGKRIGLSQKGVNKRKDKILAKLRALLEKL